MTDEMLGTNLAFGERPLKSSKPQRGGATMKHFTRLSISMLFVTLVLGVTSQTAIAQDVVQVAPQQYKVLLDNERVRVIEYQSKPGEKAGMHAHPASVAYFLSPAKLKFTSPDGKIAEVEVKAGQATWQDPDTHTTENAGTTNAHALIIELKK
jgi:quercetin dioxygenase-like cupin family protein